MIEVTWQRHSSGRKQVYSWVALLHSVCFYRNVPAAWWMRRHLNTFTHSSSLMEVKKKYVYYFYKVLFFLKRLTYSLFFFFFLQMRACMHITYSTHLTQPTMAPSSSRYEFVCFDTYISLYKFVYSGRRPECFVIGKGWFFLFFWLSGLKVCVNSLTQAKLQLWVTYTASVLFLWCFRKTDSSRHCWYGGLWAVVSQINTH